METGLDGNNGRYDRVERGFSCVTKGFLKVNFRREKTQRNAKKFERHASQACAVTVCRGFERKTFSAKKVDYSSTFYSFRLRNSFADQSESKSPWQGGTTGQWVTHYSACNVNRSGEMA